MNEKKVTKAVETLQGRAKRLKTRLKAAKDPVAARVQRKRLKRAQRKRRLLAAALAAAKAPKKGTAPAA